MNLSSDIRYSRAMVDDWCDCCNLIWKTFLKYDAPQYTPEGINNFKEFLESQILVQMIQNGDYVVFVAKHEDIVVGSISMRNINHLSLLFVDENYQMLGIGRRLVEMAADYLRKNTDALSMTVNSSPYGVKFYHKIGFIDTALEKTTNGITYTPMEYYL